VGFLCKIATLKVKQTIISLANTVGKEKYLWSWQTCCQTVGFIL